MQWRWWARLSLNEAEAKHPEDEPVGQEQSEQGTVGSTLSRHKKCSRTLGLEMGPVYMKPAGPLVSSSTRHGRGSKQTYVQLRSTNLQYTHDFWTKPIIFGTLQCACPCAGARYERG